MVYKAHKILMFWGISRLGTTCDCCSQAEIEWFVKPTAKQMRKFEALVALRNQYCANTISILRNSRHHSGYLGFPWKWRIAPPFLGSWIGQRMVKQYNISTSKIMKFTASNPISRHKLMIWDDWPADPRCHHPLEAVSSEKLLLYSSELQLSGQ